ncbi:MAG TPA: translation initiation factor IF-3 [Anaerolineae bacterium]|nr:translation initiation factor IF-3 [Anaerolineae bacterium]
MAQIERGSTISSRELRINESIRAREVRVIAHDGQNLGVVPIQEALRLARERQLDLVEVSPQADPPVCRILDYGKYLYEQQKKEREAKKAQKIIEVKEIRLRPKTDPHHRGFKVRDARKWLEQGMKVKVRIRFRGREITHPEVALQDLEEIAQELSDVAHVEAQPNMEERTMLMVLAPQPKKKSSKEEPSRAKEEVSQSHV